MAISLALEEEFDNFVFIGLPKDSFLVKIASRDDGTRISLENKGTKEQWQATVANIGECGPHRLHPDAVLCNLKAALAEASRVGQAGDGSVINVSKAEANLHLDFWLPRIGGWRPEFRFILTPVNIEKVDRLEKLIYEAQEKIKLLERLATHNADLIGEIRAYHGDVANLAANGWAVCNGTTPAEQGIECALRNEATPNLTDGEFFKGGPVENLGRRMEATTLIVSTENVGTNYTHDPVTVPTNGSSARNAKGALPYGGKWEDPATGLKLRYSQPEMQPKSYSVVYIMKVK